MEKNSDSFIILPPKIFFSDLVPLFTTTSNNELYEYFLEIDNSFEKKFNFQTNKYKDVVLNSYNNTDTTSARTSANEIPNYLF